MYPIICNSSNATSQANNFKIDLSSNFDLNNYECALSSGYVYNSWYTISSALGNNSFTIVVPTGGGSTTTVITLPDGLYNISDINTIMQAQLRAAGLFLRYAGDASNVTTGVSRQADIFPCSFRVNPVSYSIQFITISLPQTAGLVAPLYNGYVSGGWTMPTVANQVAQLTVPSTNIRTLLGYAAGTFPSTSAFATTQTIESTSIPNINPIGTIQVRLDILSNLLSINNNLLSIFNNAGKRLGEIIDISNTGDLIWIPCSGTHRDVNLSFWTQAGAPLALLDSNIAIKLVFRLKESIV